MLLTAVLRYPYWFVLHAWHWRRWLRSGNMRWSYMAQVCWCRLRYVPDFGRAK